MSSIQPTKEPVGTTERIGLFRRSSFQIFKCSATHQFQLAGSKFNKEALTKLFETLILKSRNLLQRAFLFVSFPAFKFLCAVVLWWLDVLAKQIGLTVPTENLIEIKQHATLRSYLQLNNEETNKNKTEQNVATHDALAERLSVDETDRKVGTTFRKDDHSKKLYSRSVHQSKKHNYLVVLFYHLSALLVYLQFILLSIALNLTYQPPGLLFLLSSLAFIGYILFKTLFSWKVQSQPTVVVTKPKIAEKWKKINNENVKTSYFTIYRRILCKVKLH